MSCGLHFDSALKLPHVEICARRRSHVSLRTTQSYSALKFINKWILEEISNVMEVFRILIYAEGLIVMMLETVMLIRTLCRVGHRHNVLVYFIENEK
jgi:hypothetical protein